MGSKIKTILIFLLLIPLLAFAGKEDYLFVSLHYDFNVGSITLLDVDQRVLDSSQVLISDSGDFELLLIDKDRRVISSNTFTMPSDGEVLGHLEDGTPFSTRTDSYSTTVVLPLEQSIDVEDLVFHVKKDGQIIFSEKFSADTFTVLDVKENTIRSPEPPAPKERKYLPWLVTGLAAFIIWFVWRWRTVRKRFQNSNYTVN
ncbi:MAG: hypothetical protein HYS78_02415 [Parcubacteria group bacterium]|nr:hypothetical protein [Parcubacteria group bacterium]